MARAVARQRQVPYALIIFVFLFLVAAIFAVMMFTKNDENLQRVVDLEARLKALATEKELQEDAELIKRLDFYRAGDLKGKTVVTQLQEDRARFCELLAGTTTPEETQSAYNLWHTEMFEKDKVASSELANFKNANLLEITKELNSKWQRARSDAAEAGREVLANATEISDLNAANDGLKALIDVEVQTAKNEFDRQEEDLKRQLAAATEKAAAITRQLDAIGETHSDELGENSQKINSLTAQVRQLESKLAERDARIFELVQLDLWEGKVIYPDGVITDVVDAETCYISLGKNDGIIPDMTFSVYDDGDEEITSAKAQLIVKRVYEDASQCVIVEPNPRNPVLEGNIIANIAFDKDRSLKFAVIGKFDLSGGDFPTLEEADKVNALIRKYGGEVVDTIDPQTDFVVMGYEPSQPTPPLDDDLINWDNYNRAKREFDEYNQARTKALEMQVRVLNSNRFLERIGFVPSKTLTYTDD